MHKKVSCSKAGFWNDSSLSGPRLGARKYESTELTADDTYLAISFVPEKSQRIDNISSSSLLCGRLIEEFLFGTVSNGCNLGRLNSAK
ncbi:hypothetical protein F8M41_013114 [Gigaspora margarita]|uniref:Uncharacterized protein n=1 Tax=Gigaspora margarita TaxID=4874 RepID=A0A8H4ASI5_GIGMA|nr:hypothetical protein F8M41_013114 [Gigaspora margarita]